MNNSRPQEIISSLSSILNFLGEVYERAAHELGEADHAVRQSSGLVRLLKRRLLLLCEFQAASPCQEQECKGYAVPPTVRDGAPAAGPQFKSQENAPTEHQGEFLETDRLAAVLEAARAIREQGSQLIPAQTEGPSTARHSQTLGRTGQKFLRGHSTTLPRDMSSSRGRNGVGIHSNSEVQQTQWREAVSRDRGTHTASGARGTLTASRGPRASIPKQVASSNNEGQVRKGDLTSGKTPLVGGSGGPNSGTSLSRARDGKLRTGLLLGTTAEGRSHGVPAVTKPARPVGSGLEGWRAEAAAQIPPTPQLPPGLEAALRQLRCRETSLGGTCADRDVYIDISEQHEQAVQASRAARQAFQDAVAAEHDGPPGGTVGPGGSACVLSATGNNPKGGGVHRELQGHESTASEPWGCETTKEGSFMWAHPRAQRWLRAASLVRAQSQLLESIQQSGFAGAAPDNVALTGRLLEDEEAVVRWRNRALRALLKGGVCHPPPPTGHAGPQRYRGEGLLPTDTWHQLPELARAGGLHVLLPGGRPDGPAVSPRLHYSSEAQLQALSRVKVQVEMYVMLWRLEAQVAAPLMTTLAACVEDFVEGRPGVTLEQVIACWRLAHAIFGKGAERGLAAIWQEVPEGLPPR
eukprot:jgi/Botrbrau1/8979/Bobra.0148s0086.2